MERYVPDPALVREGSSIVERVFGWARHHDPCLPILDLGTFGFALHEQRMEAFEWSNVEAAWYDADADAIVFRVERRRTALPLRGFRPVVKRRIVDEFRKRLGDRFLLRSSL